MLTGNIEEVDAAGNLVGTEAYVTSGVHSHDDGVIHWHPTGSRATGRNAQLGVFFDNYGVADLRHQAGAPRGWDSRSTAALPPDDFPLTYEEGETQCDGEDARLTVVVWEDYRDPSSSQVYTSSFDDIPFDKNGLAITIAFVPDDVDVEMPPSAANLEDLGALDTPPPAPGETVPPRSRPPPSRRAAASRPVSSEPTSAASREQRARVDHRGDDSEHRHHRGLADGARHRPRRRLRHPAAAAHRHGAEVDVDGRQRADHHPPRAPPRARRCHHGDAVARATSPIRSAPRFPTAGVAAVELRYAVEPEPLDTAGAIRFAAEFAGVDDTFLAINGDVITDLDVAAPCRRASTTTVPRRRSI